MPGQPSTIPGYAPIDPENAEVPAFGLHDPTLSICCIPQPSVDNSVYVLGIFQRCFLGMPRIVLIHPFACEHGPPASVVSTQELRLFYLYCFNAYEEKQSRASHAGCQMLFPG